ncbi:MAG TPA: glutathione peroxidase [Methylophaga aminisulfidivorans]|nr:glutathione peroxidase [Methylophaga aminisulfidivorans]
MIRYVILFISLMMFAPMSNASECPSFLNYDLPKLHSNQTVNLCDIAAGKNLLIVNTASHCGFTHQFEGLEALHEKYINKNFVVVGFASNDFNQEAKTEEEAAKVCRENFGVTFTMVAPSYVTGNRASPIFRELNSQSEKPSWNFNKYLVSADGKVIEHFGSSVEPDSESLIGAIDTLLTE